MSYNRRDGEAVIQIGHVAVDASFHEIHEMSGETTDHPVEDGSNISDHVILNPRVFSMEGVVTNQPLSVPRTQAEGVTEVDKEFTWKATPSIPIVGELGGGGLIGLALGAIASATGIDQHTGMAKGFSPDFDRVQAAYTELESIWLARERIDIYTSLNVYHDMVLTSVKVDRDKKTGQALFFSSVAKQVRTVSTEYAIAPPEPLVERGKPLTKRGKKSAKGLTDAGASAADSAAASGGKSLAASAMDWLL